MPGTAPVPVDDAVPVEPVVTPEFRATTRRSVQSPKYVVQIVEDDPAIFTLKALIRETTGTRRYSGANGVSSAFITEALLGALVWNDTDKPLA